MGNLEELIFAAWKRVAARLEHEPEKLAKRIARRRLNVLVRPPRAWCLAVRASDHRVASGRDEPEEHCVTLTAKILRRICAPVYLDPPGEPLADVARKLGTTPQGLLNGRLKEIFRTHYMPPMMGRGHPQPLLYTDKPLDPCADRFAEVDPVWLWTSKYLGTRLPDDFSQTLTRVPAFRSHASKHAFDEDRHPEIDGVSPAAKSRRLPVPKVDLCCWYKWSRSGQYLGSDPTNWRKSFDDLGERPRRDKHKPVRWRRPRPSASEGSLHFNGFLWICPTCGKSCRTIYCPAAPMHLLKHVEPRLAQCVDLRGGKIGRTFACMRCHRVRFVSRVAPGAWNQLIAYLTGGLLYGSEVGKPAWFVPVRKRAYRPIMRAAPRREHVLRRLLEGWTVERIAEEMGIGPKVVGARMREILKQEGVAGRLELAKKLKSKHEQPLSLGEATAARRKQIPELILMGLSNHEIAARLGVSFETIRADSHLFFRSEGVRGRRGLERKMGMTLALGNRDDRSGLGTARLSG